MIIPSNSIVEEEEEATQSFEVDAKLTEAMDWLLRFRRSEEKQAYDLYCIQNQTPSSLPMLAASTTIIAILVLCSFVLSVFYGHLSFLELAHFIVLVSVPILLSLVNWTVYCLVRQKLKAFGALSLAAKKLLRYYQQGIFFILEALLSFHVIFKVYIGSCESDFIVNLSCNALAKINALPPDASLCLMLLPLVYSVIVRGADFGFSLGLWAMSVGCLVGCVAFAHLRRSVLFVLYYFVVSIFVLFETRRRSCCLFFMQRRLITLQKEKARVAVEAKALEMKHMIANVAHDLKTPLAAFQTGVELMIQAVQSISQGPYGGANALEAVRNLGHILATMKDNISFMLMAINRCIDYTKASQGMQLVPQQETIDLVKTLLLPIRCLLNAQSRIDICLEPIPSEVCSHVITDGQWLQENLLCLLSNAVKYSNEGLVTVRVLLTEPDLLLEDNNERSIVSTGSFGSFVGLRRLLRVEVEDRGIGLTEESMAALFSPFRQAQRLAGGTGLGLFSLSKRMDALGGHCGVERRKDGLEGSLFWFDFPYRPDTLAAATAAASAIAAANATSAAILSSPNSSKQSSFGCSRSGVALSPSESSGLDILLVDDSPSILKLSAMMLKKRSHRVVTASNGAEAVKVFLERLKIGQRFDVILMDLQMPIMDGLEASRRIREIEGQQSFTESSTSIFHSSSSSLTAAMQYLPSLTLDHSCIIIGVSANTDSIEFNNSGMNALIGKPLNVEYFEQIFEEMKARNGLQTTSLLHSRL